MSTNIDFIGKVENKFNLIRRIFFVGVFVVSNVAHFFTDKANLHTSFILVSISSVLILVADFTEIAEDMFFMADMTLFIIIGVFIYLVIDIVSQSFGLNLIYESHTIIFYFLSFIIITPLISSKVIENFVLEKTFDLIDFSKKKKQATKKIETPKDEANSVTQEVSQLMYDLFEDFYLGELELYQVEILEETSNLLKNGGIDSTYFNRQINYILPSIKEVINQRKSLSKKLKYSKKLNSLLEEVDELLVDLFSKLKTENKKIEKIIVSELYSTLEYIEKFTNVNDFSF